jgi:hypothetical protein
VVIVRLMLLVAKSTVIPEVSFGVFTALEIQVLVFPVVLCSDVV